VGPRAGLNGWKISPPPGFDPVVSRYTDCATRPINNNNNNINLAATLTNSTYNHLLGKKILPKEQKGCHRMSREYKDQLLVSKIMLSLVKKHQRHLCRASIDYQRAFNSLPHIRIVAVMEMYQICPSVR